MRKRSIFRKSAWDVLRGAIFPVLFTIAVMAMILFGLRQTEEANRAEGLRLLEEAVMRVVMHSYAVNGYIPPSLGYIEENYNIFIDKSRYIVHYDVFASNFLPEIKVFMLGTD